MEDKPSNTLNLLPVVDSEATRDAAKTDDAIREYIRNTIIAAWGAPARVARRSIRIESAINLARTGERVCFVLSDMNDMSAEDRKRLTDAGVVLVTPGPGIAGLHAEVFWDDHIKGEQHGR